MELYSSSVQMEMILTSMVFLRPYLSERWPVQRQPITIPRKKII